MIGLVIVTHGGLANEFRAALEHVVGEQHQLEAICIGQMMIWKKGGRTLLLRLRMLIAATG